METILAGFAQFDNDVRATRTVQGMRRKIKEGIFPWNPPLGYKTVTQGRDKKTRPDEPDEPTFGLLKRAWQEFLTGAHTKRDMVRLLKAWGVATRRGKPVSPQSLDNLFKNPFYAGLIEDPWSKERFSGLHTPMVTELEFAKVQATMGRRQNNTSHQRHRDEYPLRGLVRCPRCQYHVTASTSKGRSNRYRYYHCYNRSCSLRGKSIPAATAEREFEAHLARIAPKPDHIERLQELVRKRASERQVLMEERAEADQKTRAGVSPELS